jgi:hypothetical protein
MREDASSTSTYKHVSVRSRPAAGSSACRLHPDRPPASAGNHMRLNPIRSQQALTGASVVSEQMLCKGIRHLGPPASSRLACAGWTPAVPASRYKQSLLILH